jgi:hypothetical protein
MKMQERFYEPADPNDNMVLGYVIRHRGEHVTAFHFHRVRAVLVL